ncbi:MAG TPA: TonB-dependent receptor [Steroidobacteraceae bacterium]|nr:TonB-dependent receptor [Steroidobacteraceae bacterium]
MIFRKNTLAAAIAKVLAGTGFAAMATGNVFAQEAEGPEVLEEVTVSAQLRTQSLQDVPIAIQVVDKGLIADVAAENMSDLNGYVPGLVVSGDSPTQPRYQIRGIQTGDFGVGTDPAVGVYVDGIYSARTGASMLAFNDIERIEVLKGPQGTLFGRNSAAGAISIVTTQPQDHFDSLLRARFGEYGKQYYEGMVNTPIGEDFALRVNGVYSKSDGWMQDATTGADLAPEQDWAGRVALKWNIADATSATLSWDHDDLDQLARPAISVIAVPGDGSPVPFPADAANYLDPRKVDFSNDVVGNEESRKLDQVNLFIDHSFGSTDFRSATSWRQFDTVNREDEDGTNLLYVYFDTANIESNESFYQEFRFSGRSEKLDWVAGISYYDEKADQTSDTRTFTDAIDTLGSNAGLWDPSFPLYAGTSSVTGPLFDVSLMGLPWSESMINHGKFQAYAAFGDAIWHLNDKTNLTFGLRYTHDAKEFTWIQGARVAPELDQIVDTLEAGGFFESFPVPPDFYRADIVFQGNTPAGGVTMKDSWDDVSPRLVLDYKVNPDLMVFGSLSKGYKAGGYNSLQVGSKFDNEDVLNFETGIKSEFRDAGVTLNASAFYYVYDNKQAISLVTEVPGSDVPQYLIDTSDEQAWGIDVDAQWRATDHFTLFGNLEYLDATYKDKVTQDDVDLSGEPTGEPYLMAALGARYGWELGDAGHLDLSGRFAYRGKSRCNSDSQLQGTCQVTPNFEVGEATERLDLRLGWSSPSEKYGIAGFVTNALNDQYVTGINNLTAGNFGTPFASISEPRMWGIEATVSFK